MRRRLEMIELAEIHKRRIENDYKALCALENSPFLQWKPTKGEPPYLEEYLLTLNVKSFISPDIISEYHKNQFTTRIPSKCP